MRERYAHHPIRIVVELKRSRCVDDQIGSEFGQLRFDCAVAIKRGWCRIGSAEMRTKYCSLLIAAAGDDEGCGGFVGEQLRQSTAERAIAAEDENLHPQGYINNLGRFGVWTWSGRCGHILRRLAAGGIDERE